MSLRVGVRELRDKLAEYLEASMPIEVTRHGQTIGFYIPVPKKPSQSERDALLEAGRRGLAVAWRMVGDAALCIPRDYV